MYITNVFIFIKERFLANVMLESHERYLNGNMSQVSGIWWGKWSSLYTTWVKLAVYGEVNGAVYIQVMFKKM